MEEGEIEVKVPDAASGPDRNWNPWIIAAIVLVLACVCLIGVVVLVSGWLFTSGSQVRLPDVTQQATVERTVDVGPGARLQVDNFAGRITTEAGTDGQIRVVATKHGPTSANLDRIQVDIQQQGDTLLVRTTRPTGLSNLYVDLEIHAPAGTPLDLRTGSGSVEVAGYEEGVQVDTGSGNITARDLVGGATLHSGSGSIDAENIDGSLSLDSGSGSLAVQGLTGDLQAHTGSGGISALGAEGNVRLDTGSGTLEYDGTPSGECRFETGTGSVVLRLPAELDFRILADTSSGSVEVDFVVEGRVTRQHVEGIVGTGQEATIIASTGSGAIEVSQY